MSSVNILAATVGVFAVLTISTAAPAKDAAYHVGCGLSAAVGGATCPEYKGESFWPRPTQPAGSGVLIDPYDYSFSNPFMPQPLRDGGSNGIPVNKNIKYNQQ